MTNNMKKLQLFEDENKPWERMPNESEASYSAFIVYRDLGRGRSIRQVASNLGKSQATMALLASQWKWQGRVIAWGNELDRIRREAITKEVSDMGKRHAQQAIATLRALSQPVSEMIKRMSNGTEIFTDLTHSELFDKVIKATQVLSQVVDIERKSRGEPNEIHKNDITSEGNRIRVIRPSLNNNDISEINENDT